MKSMQIMMFLFICFMSFYLLSATGIFVNVDFSSSDFDWQLTLAVSLITAFSVAAVTGLILARYGVNPYLTASYKAFIAFFLGSYGGLLSLLTMISNQFGPEVVYMMGFFLVVLTAIVILLVFYSLIQMSAGGAKGFE